MVNIDENELLSQIVLSIVVPIYNVSEYLEKCLDSLVSQDLNRCEVLLVDDGSTDRSGCICDEYGYNYPRIKVIHKNNGGLSDARNEGLKNSNGQYIMFLDGDDCLEEDSLVNVLNHLNGKNDIFVTNYHSVSRNKTTEYLYTPFSETLSGISFLEMQYRKKTMISSVVQNIYRREFLIENEFWFKKGIFHEDEEWVPRVFEKAKSVCFLPICYYVYLLRDNSIMTSNDNSKHFSDFSNTFDSLLSYFHSYSFKNPLLYSLLKDNLTDKYLSIYARGQLYRNKSIATKKFGQLKGNLFFAKTKIKVLIFSLSKKMFCKLSKIINKNG